MGKYRKTLTAKPGELRAGFSRNPDGGKDCITYAWGGKGACSADGRLLSDILEGERFRPANFDEIGSGKKELGEYGLGPSFLKELEERGYDITTLKFSIQMKASEE